MADLPPEVIQRRQQSQELLSQAGNYQAAEPMVQDILRQKVQQAYADNIDVIKPLSEYEAGYYAAPSEARAKYLSPESPSRLRDPFAAESLVSKYVAEKSIPMLTYSGIYGQRMGRIEDILGVGVRSYQATTNYLINKAEAARQSYQDAVTEFSLLEDLKERAARLQLAYREQELQKQKFEYDKYVTERELALKGAAKTPKPYQSVWISKGGQEEEVQGFKTAPMDDLIFEELTESGYDPGNL